MRTKLNFGTVYLVYDVDDTPVMSTLFYEEAVRLRKEGYMIEEVTTTKIRATKNVKIGLIVNKAWK